MQRFITASYGCIDPEDSGSFSHRKLGAEVDFAGAFIVDEIIAVALDKYFAPVHHISPIDHGERGAHAVVGDQNRTWTRTGIR